MKNYVGIDLGTTNSAVCSFDGVATRIWKSPEQNDVTPSAIYIDKRGNKHIGKRAYDSAPHNPDSAATLFKRLMGTSTPVSLPVADLTLTPEECSAEILKTLFGYLSEDVRHSSETGTVITVPAAFNQMQKNATMQAAELAGIGQVALMQEPVAAVMSVMRERRVDGIFMIYDLGGGTLDLALAESIGGRISVLAHGGIAMCGGRDFDRALVNNVVKPWLCEQFKLPQDFSASPKYKSLLRLAAWSVERAKVELSSRDSAVISLSETEARVTDESDGEIYIDIPITRSDLDAVIRDRIDDSIRAARETLDKAGLTAHDIERIVFVGGPTNYKPLRDKVAFELGIPASTDVNPMTAVAEGAAVFAESVDWESESRGRKSSRGQFTSTGPVQVTFSYMARTPNERATVVAKIAGDGPAGAEIQIICPETGWSSGKVALKDKVKFDLPLTRYGDNTFSVTAFGAGGSRIDLTQDTVTITRTATSIDAIPASHSVGIEVLEKFGGTPSIAWLVRAGDQLPNRGKCTFKAGESLKAGSSGSLRFKLLEGESDVPSENRFIGLLKIDGTDFEHGVIPAGSTLRCEYEMLDSGSIVLEVLVPAIGEAFHSGRNFYSRQEGQIDFSCEAARVTEEACQTLDRVNEIAEVVSDARVQHARNKLDLAIHLGSGDADTELTQEAMEAVIEARKTLSAIRKEHQATIRELDLSSASAMYFEHLQHIAKPSEGSACERLIQTAKRSLERGSHDFDGHLSELRGHFFGIMWRQDSFVVGKFKSMAGSPHRFVDSARHKELVNAGNRLVMSGDIESLRGIVMELWGNQVNPAQDTDFFDASNIIRG